MGSFHSHVDYNKITIIETLFKTVLVDITLFWNTFVLKLWVTVMGFVNWIRGEMLRGQIFCIVFVLLYPWYTQHCNKVILFLIVLSYGYKCFTILADCQILQEGLYGWACNTPFDQRYSFRYVEIPPKRTRIMKLLTWNQFKLRNKRLFWEFLDCVYICIH